ncbi:hypothetical protein E2C01_085317 [Portunus trituberculatus]|uniref:Secreted protein n=1 Tax=Portunus trituberculatus TaxID=210409 RepID=A0A5B7JBL5_PORTR|nr:hypothetical protein [Portunus trituberculatus]
MFLVWCVCVCVCVCVQHYANNSYTPRPARSASFTPRYQDDSEKQHFLLFAPAGLSHVTGAFHPTLAHPERTGVRGAVTRELKCILIRLCSFIRTISVSYKDL